MHKNQCDGCRQGLPVNESGNHVKDGKAWIACTRRLYVAEKENERGQA